MSNVETMSSTSEVVLLQKKNEAVRHLRKQNCAMVTTLRDHLAENIRLNGILNAINAEIAALQKLLLTPKPNLKVLILILGIIVTGAGVALGATMGAALFAVAVVGAGLIALPIVLKVLDNKKWQKMIDDLNEQLRQKKEEAAKAQQDIDEHWANHVQPYIDSITPDDFPAAYVCDYDAVCAVLTLMENLRADTVKEAINLYEQISFQNRMKAAFRSMEASLKETARNAARSAAAAERSAAADEAAAASAASMAASTAAAAAASIKASNESAKTQKAIRNKVNNS